MRLTIALLAVFLLGWSAPPADDGTRLYREGDETGSAIVMNERRQPAPPCADCHRRSREGAVEGTLHFPPLTAAALLSPRTGRAARPAYNEKTLARAIREGVDASGRALDPLMPRYTLSDAATSAIVSYLTAPPAPVPGLSSDEVRFATIVADDIAPEKRDTLVGVLQRFFAERNRDTRGERFRRGHDPSPASQPARFRRWSLSVWSLAGPVIGWRAQLARYYREQPVFAVLSGASDRDWQAVHDFCEDNAVPCIFPQTPWPGKARPAYYNLYLSRGVLFDVDVIAAYLLTTGRHQRLLQVYSADMQHVAQAFRAAWPGELEQALAPARNDEVAWRTLIERTWPQVLLLWLRKDELPTGLVLAEAAAQTQVFVSQALTTNGHDPASFPSALQMPFPYRLPPNSAFARHVRWLAARNLDRNREIGARALFACAASAEALAHPGERISRELFLERLEHMNDSSGASTLFAHASLGPGQRVLVKGAAIVRVNAGKLDVVRDSVVP